MIHVFKKLQAVRAAENHDDDLRIAVNFLEQCQFCSREAEIGRDFVIQVVKRNDDAIVALNISQQ